MSTERDIQILEHKIAQMEDLISNFEKHNISEIKKEKLEQRKAAYESQLAALQ